jgi:hypothetical protein
MNKYGLDHLERIFDSTTMFFSGAPYFRQLAIVSTPNCPIVESFNYDLVMLFLFVVN